MIQDVIILAPGSRARLIVNQGGQGPDLVLCDVSNPMHVTEDDGSEGAMNLSPQFLIFHWFLTEGMMRDYFKDLVANAVEEERGAIARMLEEAASGASGLMVDYRARGLADAAALADAISMHLTLMVNRIRARSSL